MIEYTYPISTKDQKSIWICRYGIADIHDSWGPVVLFAFTGAKVSQTSMFVSKSS